MTILMRKGSRPSMCILALRRLCCQTLTRENMGGTPFLADQTPANTMNNGSDGCNSMAFASVAVRLKSERVVKELCLPAVPSLPCTIASVDDCQEQGRSSTVPRVHPWQY